MRVAKEFLLLGMVFLAANAPAASSPANTPPSEALDSSASKILVAFKSDPGFATADRIDFSTGLRPVSSRLPSVAALLAKYSASYSRQLFAGTSLRNVYELAIQGDSSLAISELMKDPNVVYARLSDPDLEAKVAATINQINSETHGVWVAGYTIPGIMTPEDRRKLLGFNPRPARQSTESSSQQASDARFAAIHKSLASGPAPSLPSSFDWRAYNNTNYITSVKDQGACGSCWAFVTTDSVQDEANAWYNSNLGLNLSEQQLLSCSSAGTCASGYANEALDFVQATGLVSESCLPYTASDTVPCSNMCGNPTYWKISSWSWLPMDTAGDVHDLDIQIGLLAYGPFADYMAIYSDFYNYSSGIYYPTSGATQEGGHFVVAVGFGFAAPPPALNSGSDSVLYISMKNSWGTSWGESGFFNIYPGVANDNQWMEGINAPAPPTAHNAICQDLDGAGHCYWGLGPKPGSGCPSTCASSTEYCSYNGSAQPPVVCLTSASLIQPWTTVTVTPASSSIATTQSLPVTVTVSGAAGSPTPTGSVTLTSGSYISAATILSSGSAIITIPAGSLALGSDTLSASYTPDSSSSSIYGASTGAAAVTVTGTVTKLPQTITFTPITGNEYALTQLTLSAAASSGLPVTFSSTKTSICSVSGNKLALLMRGTCIVHATQAGNSSYASATTAQSFAVLFAPQTASFTPVTGKQYALTQLTLNATASSGLPVTFSSTTPTICSVSGATLTMPLLGTCIVHATQAGNSVYASRTVAQSFAVWGAIQTISFSPVAGTQHALTSQTLSATSNVGLPVTFSSTTAAVCTVSGSKLSLLTAGTCVLHANQAGNTVYAPATIGQSFPVSKAVQTVSFTPITGKQYPLTQLTLSATASSGLAVTFSSTATTVCSVAGGKLSLLTAGTCVLHANQAGNTVYAPATAAQSFAVSLLPQTIIFPAVGSQTVGANATLAATATSGLPISYTSTTTAVCTVSGSTAAMVFAGTCVLHAAQAGSSIYASATTAQSFAVKAAN